MVKIKYNGSTIASLEAGQTARLHTKDASLDGDIIITVPADMGGNEGGEEGLAPGLYETGTDTLIKSWDELLSEGVVHTQEYKDWVTVYTNYDEMADLELGEEFNPSASILVGDLVLPNEITRLGDGAFAKCRYLTNIVIPASVTHIYNEAFYGCSDLINIVIPASVTFVGDGAFSYSGLTSITFKGTPSEFEENFYYTFEGCDDLTTINVPWSEGEVEGAPWGAENATINYNYTGE